MGKVSRALLIATYLLVNERCGCGRVLHGSNSLCGVRIDLAEVHWVRRIGGDGLGRGQEGQDVSERHGYGDSGGRRDNWRRMENVKSRIL